MNRTATRHYIKANIKARSVEKKLEVLQEELDEVMLEYWKVHRNLKDKQARQDALKISIVADEIKDEMKDLLEELRYWEEDLRFWSNKT